MVTGILSQIRSDLAEGFFHESTGMVIFLAAGVILFFFHRAILFTIGLGGEASEGADMTTNPYVRVVAVLLLLEALAFYAFRVARGRPSPPVEPLVLFPSVIGDWLIYRDLPLDKEVLDILKADDTLNRFYVNQSTSALQVASQLRIPPGQVGHGGSRGIGAGGPQTPDRGSRHGHRQDAGLPGSRAALRQAHRGLHRHQESAGAALLQGHSVSAAALSAAAARLLHEGPQQLRLPAEDLRRRKCERC
jgi:hypothetical protein